MKKKFVPGIASVVGVSILLTGCGSYKNKQAEQMQKTRHLVNRF